MIFDTGRGIPDPASLIARTILFTRIIPFVLTLRGFHEGAQRVVRRLFMRILNFFMSFSSAGRVESKNANRAIAKWRDVSCDMYGIKKQHHQIIAR